MDTRGRSLIFMTALVEVIGLAPFKARVRDVSDGGCKLAGVTHLRPDEIVVLTMPGIGEQLAHVAWAARGLCGLRFERPVDADRLVGRDAPAYRHAPAEPVSLTQWQPGSAY